MLFYFCIRRYFSSKIWLICLIINLTVGLSFFILFFLFFIYIQEIITIQLILYFWRILCALILFISSLLFILIFLSFLLSCIILLRIRIIFVLRLKLLNILDLFHFKRVTKLILKMMQKHFSGNFLYVMTCFFFFALP